MVFISFYPHILLPLVIEMIIKKFGGKFSLKGFYLKKNIQKWKDLVLIHKDKRNSLNEAQEQTVLLWARVTHYEYYQFTAPGSSGPK